MIDVSCHMAGIFRELTAFYTMRKSVACSVVYAVRGAVNRYAFGNTFLTESTLYKCVRLYVVGYADVALNGVISNLMSDVRQIIAGKVFDLRQKRGAIRT